MRFRTPSCQHQTPDRLQHHAIRAGRFRFAARALLLAALSVATVVVEAGLRSGALAVARHARELSRPVYGVPGQITSPNSSGVHDLLRSGAATLITAPDQINYCPERPQ